jgi:hypothetical protein
VKDDDGNQLVHCTVLPDKMVILRLSYVQGDEPNIAALYPIQEKACDDFHRRMVGHATPQMAGWRILTYGMKSNTSVISVCNWNE